MDVRCERCRAQYVFDDEQVTPSGLTVQCTNCGHVFKVKKKELVVTVPVKPDELEGAPLPATAAAPRAAGGPGVASPQAEWPQEPPREWRLRQANGNVFTFRELTTLQKWIIEQKVSRDDEISHAGEQWRRLGDIADLASFFQVVEAAERARGPATAVPAYGVALPPSGHYPPPPSGYPPPAFAMPPVRPAAPPPPPAPDDRTPEPQAGMEVDLDSEDLAAMEEDLAAVRKKGSGGRWALAAVLLLAAAGAAAYVFAPQLFGRTREEGAAPITLEVPPKPAPPGPAEPPPAPVAAPEPVAQQPAVEPPAVEAPPAPVAKPPAPSGPKVWLAQAGRLREHGQFEEALDLYGRVAAEDPSNVEALIGRGLCYLDLERYPPAEASFEAALRVDPRDPDALLGLAETYRWQGKKADAIRYYERYLAAAPDGEEAQVAHNALEELRK